MPCRYIVVVLPSHTSSSTSVPRPEFTIRVTAAKITDQSMIYSKNCHAPGVDVQMGRDRVRSFQVTWHAKDNARRLQTGHDFLDERTARSS